MKRYSEYKDSGIEWIGEIPKGWETVRIKYLATQPNTLLLDGDWIESDVIESEGIRYLTTGNIGAGFFKEQGSGFISSDSFLKLNCTKVFPGDLIISRLNEPIGRACLVPDTYSEYVVAVDNVILRPNKGVSKSYLVYFMNMPSYSHAALLIARGTTMSRISRSQLSSLSVLLPPSHEQQKIVAFLDTRVLKIDTLIADKQKLIDLLKEKRQAIISEAVTKGLDKNTKMKDSGIEWVGEIPEGWSIKRIKDIAILDSSRLTEKTDPHYEFEYIDIGSISGHQIGDTTSMNFEESPSRARMIVKRGDVIVSTVRTYLKAIAYIDESNKYICSTGFCVISADQIDSQYLYFYCMSEVFIQTVVSQSTGVSYPAINSYKIGNILIPYPPRKEQNAIVGYVKSETEKIDSLISDIQTQIDKLKEYRQSIISEAVTGKVAI